MQAILSGDNADETSGLRMKKRRHQAPDARTHCKTSESLFHSETVPEAFGGWTEVVSRRDIVVGRRTLNEIWSDSAMRKEVR